MAGPWKKRADVCQVMPPTTSSVVETENYNLPNTQNKIASTELSSGRPSTNTSLVSMFSYTFSGQASRFDICEDCEAIQNYLKLFISTSSARPRERTLFQYSRLCRHAHVERVCNKKSHQSWNDTQSRNIRPSFGALQ